MAMYQNAQRVNVEFLKSSTLKGRIIKLNYQAAQVPAQLYGRVDLARPTIFLAAPLKEDLVVYVIKPSAGQVARWGMCFSLAAVVGCWSINPDGGSYPQWEAEVVQLIERFRQPFAQAGCNLSLQQTREYWVQIDIVGPPLAQGYPSIPPKEGFEHGYGDSKPSAATEPPQQWQGQPQPYGQPSGYQVQH